MKKIILTDAQAVGVRDAIRAGNTEFTVFLVNRRTARSLYAKGLTDSDTYGAHLSAEGKDVAGQLKAHPRRRTFYITEPGDHRVLRVQTASRIDNMTADGQEMTQQPYPLFVGEDGSVGRQDFWNGRIYRVVGFHRDLAVQQVDLWWKDAWTDPQQAVGMYVVAADADRNMFSLDTAVESITRQVVEEGAA